PGGIGRPGRVTRPTPSPRAKVTPEPDGPRRTVAVTTAPWVTSGSSPASLTIAAVADSSDSSCRASEKATRRPDGSAISTGSGNWPQTSAVAAAFAAAAAQAPVVQPRFSGVPEGGLSSVMA